MDNRVISINSEGRADFDLAMQLMFGKNRSATHYIEHAEKGLIFFWTDPSSDLNANKLPYKMNWKAAADLAWGWLLEKKDSDYKEYLDHDGSNGHGFKVYNEDWGHVAGAWQAIAGVLPIWAWYGK
jgi:hypothetical protein